MANDLTISSSHCLRLPPAQTQALPNTNSAGTCLYRRQLYRPFVPAPGSNPVSSCDFVAPATPAANVIDGLLAMHGQAEFPWNVILDSLVRVRPQRFTGRPLLVDPDPTTFIEWLRDVARQLTMFDGPDDLGGGLDKILPLAGSAPTAAAVKGGLSIFVTLLVIGSVSNARNIFRHEYPEAIRLLLDMERAVIRYLRRAGIGTPQQIQDLENHVNASNEELDHHGDGWRARRQRRSDAAHRNDTGAQGNMDRAREFTNRVGDIVHQFAEESGLPGQIAFMVQHLKEGCDNLAQTKHGRTKAAANAFLMGLMDAALKLSTIGSGLQIKVNAAKAAGQVVDSGLNSAQNIVSTIASGALCGAQFLQGCNAGHTLYKYWGDRNALKEIAAAVKALGSKLAPDVHERHAQTMAFMLRHNNKLRAVAATLSVSQFVLFVTSVLSLTGIPAFVTGPVSLLFASTTLTASFLQGRIDKAKEIFEGMLKDKAFADRLSEDPAEIAQEIQGSDLDKVLKRVGDRYAVTVQQVASVRLYRDIVKSIKATGPNADIARSQENADKLYETVKQRNGEKHDYLLEQESRCIGQLRRTQFSRESMKRPSTGILQSVYERLLAHDLAPAVLCMPGFLKKMVYGTGRRLENDHDPDVRRLFFDAKGNLVENIDLNALKRVIDAKPQINAIFMEECCLLMSKGLLHLGLHLRHTSQNTIETLAFADQACRKYPQYIRPDHATWL